MKIILWGGVALLALFWTGGAAVLAEAVQWSAQWVSAGSTSTLEATAKNIVLPVWLAPWFEPAGIASVLETLQDMLSSFSSVLPTMGMVVGWLLPAIWITWLLGVMALVGLGIMGSLMLSRFQKS
jgi:hypothetical protein